MGAIAACGRSAGAAIPAARVLRRGGTWAAASALLASNVFAAPPPARSAVLRLPAWLSPDAPTPPRFAATVDGEEARVLSVKGPDEDLLLLLVLDLTGDLSLVEPAKRALVSEIGGLPPRTWVALLKSQDGLQVVADPTPDRARITDLVEKLPSTGRPGLLDTIEEAARLGDSILARAQVRLAVLYVTDSDVRGYREDFTNPVINSSDSHDLSRRFPEVLVREKISKLDEKLAARQTPCFIVHLDYRSDRLNEAYQIGLKQLAETSGGTATFARSLTEIPENIKAVFASIGSHSSVALELPKTVRRAFQVRLTPAGGEGGQISHRTRFLRGKE
jgi:hypothetical protein